MSSSKKIIFVYSGHNAQGKLVEGQIRAENSDWARHKLRKQGVRVSSIKKSFQAPFSQQQTIVPSDIALFTQQLAMLLKVGIPLSKGLLILSASCNKSIMKMLLTELKDDLATGDSFARALRKHPYQFDELYCNMVESAELSGELTLVLERLARYQERSEKLKKNLKKALTYPCMVLTIALVVTGILLAKVIPQFSQTFTQFEAELPPLTLFVLNLSDLFKHHWVNAVLLFILGIGLWVIGLKHSLKLSHFKDNLLIKLPLVGGMVRNAVLARFSRSLATAFNAGIPILDALGSAANTAGNLVYKQSILNLRQDLVNGISLYHAMSNQRIFPVAFQQMIVVGEESGTLGSILDKVSGFYEQDLALSVDTLMGIIEPLLMVFLGLLIGGLLLAMYLPIFQIGSII
jgi:type IV pilus assembly protein PilC